jgi:hypothetical protein
MTIVVVLFNLKAGADVAEYESWARERDLPNVNSLDSVERFRVLRTRGLMNGSSAPYQYVELIELHSLDGLRVDVKSELMQTVAQEFRRFADAPQFIIAESL